MKNSFTFILSAVCLCLNVATLAEENSTMATDDAMAASTPAKETTPLQILGKMPVLEATVGKYVTAWQQDDFKTMLSYESWEGGDSLNETGYIQSFDGNFHIGEWKITKVEDLGNGQYRVLVLITHNPPAQVASFVPEGKMVRSTLVQFWKKQGEQFVHLYNVEKQTVWEQYQQQIPKP